MLLKVLVKPNAKKLNIERLSEDTFKINLNAPPIDGKANEKLIKVLSDYLNIPKSRIFIKAGKQSRRKLIEIYD